MVSRSGRNATEGSRHRQQQHASAHGTLTTPHRSLPLHTSLPLTTPPPLTTSHYLSKLFTTSHKLSPPVTTSDSHNLSLLSLRGWDPWTLPTICVGTAGAICNGNQMHTAHHCMQTLCDSNFPCPLRKTYKGGGFMPNQIRSGQFPCGKFHGDPWILCGKFRRHCQKCCGV